MSLRVGYWRYEAGREARHDSTSGGYLGKTRFQVQGVGRDDRDPGTLSCVPFTVCLRVGVSNPIGKQGGYRVNKA